MRSCSRRVRRWTAAVLGLLVAVQVGGLAVTSGPFTWASFSDFGTVKATATAATWDSTPSSLAYCGDLSQYDEIVYADPVTVHLPLGVTFTGAAVDGDDSRWDTGTPKVVDLHAGGGDDQIIVGAGNAKNFLYGGKGNDCLVGGGKTDVLAGGGKSDVLLGGAGIDFLFGGHGDDTMYGGSGFDTMLGGPGADTFYWEGFTTSFPFIRDLLLDRWGETVNTPDPTAGSGAGMHLMMRSLGLNAMATTADAGASGSGIDKAAAAQCSDTLSAALPAQPPSGADAQQLIDTLTTSSQQCTDGDSGGTTDKQVTGLQSGDSQSGDQPSGDSQSGDQPSGDQPSGDQPSGDSPSGDSPSGDSPSGDSPSGDSPSGDSPSGDSQSGDSPSGDSQSGDSQSGDSQSGDSQSGDQSSGSSTASNGAGS